jgi:hypothetical protein
MTAEPDSARSDAPQLLLEADRVFPFGPSFFLHHLGGFVRDRCPDPQEHMPVVEVHLADGETMTVCHIVGVSPRWVVFAVRTAGAESDVMAIECIPFAVIRRVTIHARRPGHGAVGFKQVQPPSIVAAEALLQAAMPTIT